ncbi:diguanylate cyclase (GGDEF) domain-containing protein [Pseudobacteriovorax antillogorgiicola]|uniref:Diguanylate cyclase (GGDEF) domain-containing protein n=2 Tax=Pseudobacteriovorax antillogorgiicola TaxID=1513793 RepID=A0A1Y6CFF6_9BACT|nr:diguanylate cyclase (GGDEF)-like protein [Pseudobacteriovorax antillogorgiicola]SMF49503.1 diguanylate cyclase (GGDEF) domain-containing protein [Pseudobacteriovorax antillogorgiicola]
MPLNFKKKSLLQPEPSTASVPGYHSLVRIFESPRSRIFRAIRKKDQKKVVLKILQEEFIERSEILRYKNQFSILSHSDLKCAPRVLDLVKYHNSPMLVFEDTGIDSLQSLLEQSSLKIKEALEIAIAITEALMELHSHSIIHKDINPSNLLYDRKTGEIQVIDFGISTQLSREHMALDAEMVTEGSLPYMSPEQTGRMNRYLDSRTDLYSLGIVIYELLTGAVPFQSEDPLQLIHYHIAKRPIPPKELDNGIPGVLSDIVMKLLSKNVEDRYQSAWGVKADLQKCAEGLRDSHYVRKFPLGLQDVSNQLRISQNLYGRSQEVALLQSNYESVVGGNKVAVFISGYPGVGKTSLTKELYKQVSHHRGFYISGKYEILRRSVPYSAITEAFTELCRQILSESEYLLHEWRHKIQNALGDNGQVMVDLVPELEHIIGVQPAAQLLGPSESENRFLVLFKKFVKIFAQANHPLVMYLDDLQWIDLSSIRLLQMLLEDSDLEGLYFIGAFRDKDIGPTHPLGLMMERLQEASIIIDQIHLQPLSLPDINRMVADTLHTTVEKSEALSDLVFQKTGGNPFFTEEFLKNLYTNKLLYFEAQKGHWDWELDKIKYADLTDNVVELMTEKIKRLPEGTVELIRYGACIGARFDLATLATVANSNLTRVAQGLHQAINEGLVIPIGDNYRLIELDIPIAPDEVKIEYRFAHDRILQAACDLMESRQRKFVRRRVAKIMLDQGDQFREENIFTIVNHLNQSMELIQAKDELIELLKLNLDAARKAKSSSAYPLAFEYLSSSYDLIDETMWDTHCDLLIDFCQEACEVAFLAQEIAAMEKFASLVLQKGRNLLEKIPIYETQVQAAVARNDMMTAVSQGKEILGQLGVRVPDNPSLAQILKGFAWCWWKLLGVDTQKILDKQEMKDPYQLARIHFQYSLSQCIFLYMPKQVPLSICDSILTTMKHGVAPTSALAFTSYGIMISGIFHAYDTGYRYGELGIQLYQRLKAKEVEATILVTFNLYIRPWKDPVRSTLPSLLEAYQSGLDSGNIEFAVHGAMGYCYRSFLAGVELRSVQKDMKNYRQAIRSLAHHGNTYILDLYHQAVENLVSEDEAIEPWRIKGDYYDDDEMLVTHRQNKDAAGLFLTYFMKVKMAYIYEQNELALEWGEAAKKEFKAGIGTYNGTVFYFYRALSLLKAVQAGAGIERKRFLREAKSITKKFKKWAKASYDNQGHRYLILKAEWQRLHGRSFQAQQLYDEAITVARHHEFYQDEALGNELAAMFHLAENRHTMAVAYMKRARYGYQRWGALSKVSYLEKNYPHLINSPGDRTLTGSLATMSSSTIDITTLKKALLAIAEETIHSRMLEKIISSAIEFAGAQKGILLLKKDGEFYVEAEGSTDLEKPKILQSIPLEESEEICIAVINYVKRTAKPIVIDDAQVDQDLIASLSKDPYIVKNKVKSILCIPILVGGAAGSEIIGLLYLENNHTSNTFTVERIETLEIICLSAAGRLELSVKAATDGLTGLYNHDYFQNMLEQEILQSQRQLRNLSLVMIDIDHFKKFNDKWGHQVGDLVLKHVADLVKQTCRKSDIVARYGGEELSVILPETNSDLAENVAERIRQVIEKSIVEHEGHHLNVTVSLGVSYLREDIRTATALIKRADEALYASKENGRNCVTLT